MRKLSISDEILMHMYHFLLVYIYILNGYRVHTHIHQPIGLVRKVFANDLGDQGSIPSHTKDSKNGT